MSLSYESSGVRYDELDAFKRAVSARHTRPRANWRPMVIRSQPRLAAKAPTSSRRRSLPRACRGGARDEEPRGGCRLRGERPEFYREIGIDLVATIVNDLVTCGALSIAVAMHAAVGDSSWFADEKRTNGLVEGFAEGCRSAGAVWGGGETPTLRGVVDPKTIVLAGSPLEKFRRSRVVSRGT